MSKDRKKLLHIHSSVNDKQPTPSTLELGELGVNNAKGNAFISTKNSDGEVVRFSEDDTIINWMEMKEIMPYEAKLRGSDGVEGELSQSDLINNQSNIIFKLNQVAPKNTPHDENVNGARDIYGNEVNPYNPTDDTDGAGFAIDMSRYAMIGANPSFSSVTTTCKANFNGTTTVSGSDGDCGSAFNVDVNNVCIDAEETLNVYGKEHSNFGTSCDGNNISEDTTLKGEKILIDSPSGDETIDMKACEHISGKTDNFTIVECNDGDGSVTIDTTSLDTTACTHNYNNTNDFKVLECNEGSGETLIKSCKSFEVNSNDINLTQCDGGEGTTNIKSCSAITLESKNITLTDGDCGSGQTTIEVNDLCLVGESKVNVYGKKTNLGLDCDDITIAEDNRVFGNAILITTNSGDVQNYADDECVTINVDRRLTENARDIYEYALATIVESGENIFNTATQDICDQANHYATFYGKSNTKIGVSCDNETITEGNTSVYGRGVLISTNSGSTHMTVPAGVLEEEALDIKEEADRDIYSTAGNDINITADNNICEKANADAYFLGVENTVIGLDCGERNKAENTKVLGGGILMSTDDDFTEADNGSIDIVAVGSINENAANIYEAAENIYETAHSDICDQAASGATFYGAASTNLGINCDDTATAATTTVKGGRTVIDASTTNLGLTAKQDIVQSAENDITITANNNICEQSGNEAHFYGASVTHIGAGCDGSKSADAIIYERIPRGCITAETVDDALYEVLDRDRVHISSTTYDHGAAPSAITSAVTTHNVWQDSGSCKNEVSFKVNDTIVTMSAETLPASDEMLKKYTLWQYIGDQKIDIGEINIPKDHMLKNAEIKNGYFDDDEFVECSETGDTACTWFIKLTWNVYNPESGHADDKVIYVPANDLVVDHVFEDSPAIKLDSWYDGKQMHVSADTTIRVTSFNNPGHISYVDHTFNQSNGTHSLNSAMLLVSSGAVLSNSARTNFEYDAFADSHGEGKNQLTIPTDASHINRAKLKIVYGPMCGSNFPNDYLDEYDPGLIVRQGQVKRPVNTTSNSGQTLYLPKSVADLPHSYLTIEYGNVSGGTDTACTRHHTDNTTFSYDPGSYTGGTGCTHQAFDRKLNIPYSLEHLVEFNGCCYMLDHDICMSGYTIAAKAFYSVSDKNLKENIKTIEGGDLEKIDSVDFKSFNFKDDKDKRKVYGVIAQDVEAAGLSELVHKNEDGMLTVDYTSLLLLKIASLEKTIENLSAKIDLLAK